MHTILQEFDDAETSLERSLHLRRQQGDTLGERASLRGFSFLRWLQARYEDALAYGEAALAIDRQHNRLNAIVGDLQNLASVYTIMAEQQRARACLEEALTLSNPAKRGTDPQFQVMWESRLAVLYSYGCLLAGQGELDRALEYLGPGGEWAREKQNPIRGAQFFMAAASVHLRRGRTSECLEAYEHAIELARRFHFAPQLGQALQLYAQMLMAVERTREAIEAFEEAARVHAGLGDRASEALTRSRVARAHETQQLRRRAAPMATYR
jgi:tetratricopeptide (TPR) repeat protein